MAAQAARTAKRITRRRGRYRGQRITPRLVQALPGDVAAIAGG